MGMISAFICVLCKTRHPLLMLQSYIFFLKSKTRSTIYRKSCFPLQSFCSAPMMLSSPGTKDLPMYHLTYKSFTNVQDNNRKQKVFPLQSGLTGKSILPTLRSSHNSYFPSQLYFFLKKLPQRLLKTRKERKEA